MPQHQPKLFEGLRRGDLVNCVDNLFTIDQFKSKMGEDRDVIVLRFKVNDKNPAIDIMEFIEKGYAFVLDSDISSGEEKDGKYSVFVELQRSENAATQIKEVLSGLSQLCNNTDWRFRFHKDFQSIEFSEEKLNEMVPLTPEDYENKLLEFTNKDANQFLDQGATDGATVDAQGNMTIEKPYAENLEVKLVDIGDYEILKDKLPGAISLDESSTNQVSYLEKYLGNYEIHKINEHFLIRNGDRAMIIRKDTW